MVSGVNAYFSGLLTNSKVSKDYLNIRAKELNSNKTEYARLLALTKAAVAAISAAFGGLDASGIQLQSSCNRGQMGYIKGEAGWWCSNYW